MKTVLFSLLAVGTFALTSCKENKEQKSTTETSMKHDMSTMSDSAAMGNMATDKEIPLLKPKSLPLILRSFIPITPTLHSLCPVMMIKKRLVQRKGSWPLFLK